jgi:hypothetical protein
MEQAKGADCFGTLASRIPLKVVLAIDTPEPTPATASVSELGKGSYENLAHRSPGG